MENYKPNSEKFKAEQAATSEKKIEKVVLGEVVIKKKKELPGFVKTFIAEDMENIKNYILYDILVPSAKRMVQESIDAFFNGGKPKGRITPASKVSYVDYYDRNDYKREPRVVAQTLTCVDDIILPTYADADQVLDVMNEITQVYGSVRIADFCELIGITGNYTDNNYGWENVASGKVVRVSGGGYSIKLPRPLPIK